MDPTTRTVCASRSVLWCQRQELQRPVALQVRSVPPSEFSGASSRSYSVLKRCTGQKQRRGAFCASTSFI